MNITKILVAGLIGGAVAFLLGFLTFGMALSDFFASNSGSATGVMRADGDMQWIPMILGHLSLGMLLAVIYGRWANISTMATGAKAGLVIGFLVAFAYGMIDLGAMNIMNTTGTLVDIVAQTVIAGIVGGAVGWYLGMGAEK